ncbi:tryptophan 7-halogenase [Alteromonas sp. D210916BOD_24]|uniref:tryptophan halogenase family protein n=1 Tax=Alteromonas sp. D210916BOD_24 TaxID=3157618 RepID=UPI00399D4481
MTQPNYNNAQQIKRIVIIGGGTAGWLSAGVLASKLNNDFSVTLIESPNVPTIGVGEGSWPSLRDTLMDIGINETQFLTLCHGSFKQGSSFINWRSTSAAPHSYCHPFTVPIAYNELDTHACWQAFAPQERYEDAFSLQAAMCKAGKAPKQNTTPDYAHVLNYGYHFDATALANLLKTHCTEQLKVHHKQAHIASVHPHANGYIDHVVTDSGDAIYGDLFIDCSGSHGLLIDKHFSVPWVSVANTMLNNRALAVQVPYSQEDDAIASTTVATAQESGWTWDIGLQHRRGVGLVYASDFLEKQQAEDTLLKQASQRYPAVNTAELSLRNLEFSPGYRQQFWVKNCLSLGMSSGFVEPLEASAIAMVELGLRMLCEAFPHSIHHMEHVSKRYNKRFTYRWERVIDFLKLHYVLSDREEPYWRAQRHPDTIPASLSELLDLWQYQSPSRLDLIENEEIFPSASYQYVLYGMGYCTRKTALKMTQSTARKAADIREKMRHNMQAYLHGLPSNRELLTHLAAQHAANNNNKEQKRDLIGFR